MKYSAPIDGLRALAVLGVFVFHVTPDFLPGGFLGVDVFFVLSGYLLTSIILHAHREGRFSYREFYLRRIQRLLPNAVLTIGVTVGLSFLLLFPSSAVGVAHHGLWALFSLSNFYILKTFGGYWGPAATSAPLLHTWSLAVEEQFYLVFPALLLALAHGSRRTRLIGLLSALTLLSFSLGVFGGRPPAENFYLLPARAWELFLGGMLAVHRGGGRRVLPRWAAELLGWLGGAAIGWSFFRVGESSGIPGWSTLPATLGTSAVLLAIFHEGTWLARGLAWPAVVLVGTWSYSIYLWHWPLIVLGRLHAQLRGWDPAYGAWIGAAVCLPVAVAAYYGLERPLRHRGPGRQRRLQIIGCGFGIVAAAVGGAAYFKPQADPLGLWDPVEFYGKDYDVKPFDIRNMAETPRFYDVILSQRQSDKELWREGGIQHLWGGGNPKTLVWGSSHALMLGKVLDEMSRERKQSIAFFAADGVPVFREDTDFDRARFATLERWKPERVILVERWDGVPGTAQELETQLRDLVRAIAPHTQRIFLLSQVPALEIGDTNLREYATAEIRWKGAPPRIPPDGGQAKRQAAWRVIQKLAAEFPKVRAVDTAPPFYQADGSIRYAEGRKVFYIDDDHLSQAGAEHLRATLEKVLR